MYPYRFSPLIYGLTGWRCQTFFVQLDSYVKAVIRMGMFYVDILGLKRLFITSALVGWFSQPPNLLATAPLWGEMIWDADPKCFSHWWDGIQPNDGEWMGISQGPNCICTVYMDLPCFIAGNMLGENGWHMFFSPATKPFLARKTRHGLPISRRRYLRFQALPSRPPCYFYSTLIG